MYALYGHIAYRENNASDGVLMEGAEKVSGPFKVLKDPNVLSVHLFYFSLTFGLTLRGCSWFVLLLVGSIQLHLSRRGAVG
jgi:hypothetical protein